jgi:hypothetical protein
MRNRLFLVPMLGALLAVAACSEGAGLPSSPEQGYNGFVPPSASQGSGSVAKSNGAPQLVYCKPFDQATRSATIGILGGTIKVGPHTLVVPPGSLLTPRTITARILKNDYSHSVVFSPEGLRFVVPALLTLSYSGCDNQTMQRPLKVVYTSDLLDKILDLLPSSNNPFNQTTTGTIEHFSRYAIAY